jgi:hypothetical protein
MYSFVYSRGAYILDSDTIKRSRSIHYIPQDQTNLLSTKVTASSVVVIGSILESILISVVVLNE